MFGRKPPKPRKLSFLHSTIKSMVQKDLENDSDEENSEIPNPITWWDLTEEQLLKIPFHLR